jgi:lipid II:glycine glycyltransferase (peptidoglycan interpeptide bridge formation enzyme)
MQSEKEKAEDFEKKLKEAHRISEEKQKKLDEADGKLQMLQETVQRFLFCLIIITYITSPQ